MDKTKTILIIDDNEVNRKILAKILSSEYEVLIASDGQDGLEALKNHQWEIAGIMLDLVMPKMNGFEFLAEKAKHAEYENIPVIVTTGINDEKAELAALEYGAWDFVSKPYKPEIIKFRLRNCIIRSQLTAFNQLKYLAEFDSLTEIYNKNKFFEITHDLLIHNRDTPYVFMRADINRFGLVNSYFGTKEGDKLLQYTARCFSEICRDIKGGTYGRIVSDIFAMCIPYKDKNQLAEMAKLLENALRNFNLNFDLLPTIGYYIIDDYDMPVSTIFDKASLAAKKCKGDYINNYAVYVPQLSESLEKSQRILNDMHKALKEEQFYVYLQPKYDTRSCKPIGAEALVRWIHPQRGMISPGEFIPVFEQNGFISKLDYYMWEHVCQLIRKWIDAGKDPYPISVNVSRVNLHNPNLVDIIYELTDKYKIPAKLLNLELTESAYTDDPLIMKNTMKTFQEKGFTIMMDDFGSGYSSLNVLKDISIDVLKIDMKFLSEIEISERSKCILESIIQMSQKLQIQTIVEGVEKKNQVDFLSEIGCHFVQGYYFAKPMPISDYEKLQEQHND